MIHHVSIPARDPNHVAGVLCELTGWKARPFLGPVPGAIMMLAEDGRGTAIELYPDGFTFEPGAGEEQGVVCNDPPVQRSPFHFLLSLDVDPAEVERIGAREGWRTLRCWRGPPQRPVFELIEFWIENRIMIEIATPDMLPNYLAAATAEAHDAFLAAMGGPPPGARAEPQSA
jgi:hypothetical protein